MSSIQFYVRGIQIDEVDGLMCLNVVWMLAGEPKNQDPREWARSETAKGLVKQISSELNVGISHIWKSRPGRSGGTWAHWKIALAYAAYLDPKLHSEILETYKQVKAGDPEIAKEIIRRTSDPTKLKEISDETKNQEKYLQTYWGVHEQLKAHNANEGIQHGSYNKHVNQLAGVPTGKRAEMSREQQLKIILAQTAGELDLIDSPSQGWDAVNEAKDAGSRVIKALKPGR